MTIFPDFLENKTMFDEKDFFDGNKFKFYEFACFYMKNITVAILITVHMCSLVRNMNH
ncbi:putative DNA primase-phage associated [Staphylococcus aureus]|nr:putative DNA primase-phage associated [Staphylococcus aureus]